MPDVFTAKTKPESFQPHGLIGHSTCQGNKIGPTKPVAVFFLDGPEQTPGFIQICVIRPGIQRGKSLVTGTCTTPTVGDTIRACGVPGHTDHKSAILSPICRPPLLTIGHKSDKVF